jgi:hypothetical protein
VQLHIQIEVSVGLLPVCCVTQGATWSSVIIDGQEREVAICLSLHGDLDIVVMLYR